MNAQKCEDTEDRPGGGVSVVTAMNSTSARSVCSYHGPHIYDVSCAECRGDAPPGSASVSVGDGLVLPRSVLGRNVERVFARGDADRAALRILEQQIEQLRSAVRRSLAKYGECEGRRILEIALEDSL